MLEVIDNFFTSGPFIPHGHCYLWKPELVGFHLIADLLIAIAYYSIPITLIYFVRKRADLPYPWIFLLFGAFITACGTTHLMEIWTLWHPTYWLSGIIKAMTALISMYTAATLLPLIPQALALPSPTQLEVTNRELEHEIKERKQIETALQKAHDELENRVKERTAELVKANERLSNEIAEREQVQETLRQSEIQNRAILEAIPDLLLRVSKDGSYLECIFPKDLNAGIFLPINEHICEILPPELLQRQLQSIEQALMTGELQVYEHQLIKYDQLAYEELRITPIGDNEVLIIVRDITARKQAEDALRQSEHQLRLITDALPVLVSYVDTQQCYRFNNRAYEQWFGHQRKDITGQSMQEILGEKACQSIAKYVKAALAGQEVTYESIVPYQDGGTRYVQATYLPHFGEQGEVKGYIGLVSDMTERKLLEENLRQAKEELEEQVQKRTKQLMEANQALQQSEARYRAIVEDQTELITRFSANGTLTFVNDAYCRYFGLKKHEVIGNRYEPLILEEDREKVARLIDSITLENPVVINENRVMIAGQIRWTQWINRIILDDQGRFVEFQSVGRDITELKQAETILTRSRDFYLSLFEEFPVLIWRSDIDTQCNYFNKTWLAFTGRSLEQEIGYGWAEGVHPDDLEQCLTTYLNAFHSRQYFVMEYRLRASDGSYRWLINHGTSFSDLDGNFAGYLGSCYDISDRKQAQADLQKAYEELERRVQERTKDLAQVNQELQIEVTERKRAEEQIKASLKEKEVLLQEIHHRVKNNLQVICSLLNLQSRNIKDQSAVESLKESQNRIRSMALIHEKLYQSEDLSRINFAEYIRYLVNNLFRSYGVDTNRIILKTEISNRILLDVDTAVNCGLIVNELISNSLKYAFPKSQKGLISVKIHLTQAQGLVMLISDNGTGLPPNFDLENAKTLGLKLVNSWIAQLNGKIEINSHFQGTEFEITLAELD